MLEKLRLPAIMARSRFHGLSISWCWWVMLGPLQIIQVFLQAVLLVACLWAFSLVSGFFLSHIVLIAILALLAMVFGVWYGFVRS